MMGRGTCTGKMFGGDLYPRIKQPEKIENACEIATRIPDALAKDVVNIINTIHAKGYKLSDVKCATPAGDEYCLEMNNGEKISVPIIKCITEP